MKSKIFIIASIVSIIGLGCEYEKMAPDEVLSDKIIVSFNKDVTPIFEKSCNSSSCHGAGGNYPDLSTGNAYTVLLGSDLIDTTNASNSELYKRMTGESKPIMPTTGLLSKKETSIIFNWIKQGAQNN